MQTHGCFVSGYPMIYVRGDDPATINGEILCSSCHIILGQWAREKCIACAGKGRITCNWIQPHMHGIQRYYGKGRHHSRPCVYCFETGTRLIAITA